LTRWSARRWPNGGTFWRRTTKIDIARKEQETDAAPLPLSTAQYGIWLLQQLDLGSLAYRTVEAGELDGMLDQAAFVLTLL
jgi:hypothetical protein